MVVVGLHPNCDIQALQRQYVSRKFEGSGKFRGALGHQNQSRIEPSIEPQVFILNNIDYFISVVFTDTTAGGPVVVL